MQNTGKILMQNTGKILMQNTGENISTEFFFSIIRVLEWKI